MISKLGMAVAVLVAAGVVLLFVVRNWPERGTPVGQVTGTPIAGDEVVVLVSGWSDSELQTILSDFGAMYDLPKDTFRVRSQKGPATQIEISRPIAADVLVFLINYLNYPKDLRLQGRQVAAIASVRRSELLGGPRELAWRHATIYVPTDDAEYDQVFVRVDPARYFRISFTQMHWRSVEDGREGRLVRNLIDSVLDWPRRSHEPGPRESKATRKEMPNA